MKHTYTKSFLITSLAVLSWCNVNAQWAYVDRGSSAGAGSGLCVYNNKIYSTSAGQGVYISSDGVTWNQAITGMQSPTGLQAKFIGAIGTDVFVSTPLGIYKSPDEGANWTLLPNDVLKSSQSNYATAFYKFNTTMFVVMIAPIGTAGTGTGIFKSDDMGTTWLEANSGLPLGGSCYKMAEAGSNLFVGTSLGLYKSTDSGATWQKVTAFAGAQCQGLINYEGRLMAFGEYSDDDGVTWLAQGSITAAIPAIASRYNGFVTGNGDTLYAFSTSNYASAINNGLAYTVDKGGSWAILDKTGLGTYDLQSMYDMAFFDDHLYLAAYLGVLSNKAADDDNGITHLQNESVIVTSYPTPSNGVVNFRFADKHLSNINIIDISGRLIESININNSNQASVDLSTSGLYFYQVLDDNNVVVYTNKIVIE